MDTITNVDAYMAQFNEEERVQLQTLRQFIRQICPSAEETMRWGMPTYRYCGFNLVHFAQQKHHIGFYPADTGVNAFQQRLTTFTCTKGSIHFENGKVLPKKLINDILIYRMKENEQYAIEKEQKNWTLSRVRKELHTLGNERTKRLLKRYGAQEPYDGVAVKDLKQLMKKTGKQHSLAMALYDTGHYDAMYFAGMIAQPDHMCKEDFEHWMKLAYCYGISDHIVAVTLAETTFAQELANDWIDHEEERYQSAGWSCYIWLLGVKPDDTFIIEQIRQYLNKIEITYATHSDHMQQVLCDFMTAVAISYQPLHKDAYERIKQLADRLDDKENKHLLRAHRQIETAIEKRRIGFKRKHVRC